MKDLYSIELPALGDTSCSMKARRPVDHLAGFLSICWPGRVLPPARDCCASRQLHTHACACSICCHLPPSMP